MSNLTILPSRISFIVAHWTDLMTGAAVIGHFFSQKTIIAKLGTIADNAKSTPPTSAADVLNKVVNDWSNLNK